MAKTKLDEQGAEAEYLGRISGMSGAMQLIVTEGHRAREWAGWDGEEDGRNRTMLHALESEGAGLSCWAGGAGAVSVWKTDEGIALAEFFLDENVDSESKSSLRALGRRVAQLRATKKKTKAVGTITVRDGGIAAFLSYATTDSLTAATLRRAAKKKNVTNFECGGILPVTAGTYEVVCEQLEHQDDLGVIGTRVRIVAVAGKRKQKQKSTEGKKQKIDTLGARAAHWGTLGGVEPFELIVADANVIERYDGDEDWERANASLQRKRGRGGELKLARAGVIALAQGPGLTLTLWELEKGFGMLDLDRPKQLDLKNKSTHEALGAVFAQARTHRSVTLGRFRVRGGGICVLRTMASLKKPPRVPAKRPRVLKRRGWDVGAVLRAPNGTYEVVREALAPGRDGLSTEIARVHVRTRIIRVQ